MLQVTIPSVDKNNLDISLSVYLLEYNSDFLYYCMEATDLQVVALSDTV